MQHPAMSSPLFTADLPGAGGGGRGWAEVIDRGECWRD